MLEVADVLRRFGPAYLAQHGAALLPSHRRAIADLQLCRTSALGGHHFRCDACGKELFAWHSCKNRACPKCHTTQTDEWLRRRRAQMLPIPYFHVVVTVPQELRTIFRANQRDCYALLMQASGEAIVELARNPRYCGGTVGVLEVLHTWTQQLHYHPHVHCLVTGGGISDDGSTWQPVRHMAYFVPVKALSRLVRGKFLAWLRNKRPDLYVPDSVWAQDWVVHCTPWRAGETAVLEYLARYAFRVALANCRLLAMDAQTVTFRYTDRETGKRHQCAVCGANSFVASCSTYCPDASTDSDTAAYGIPPSARFLSELAQYYNLHSAPRRPQPSPLHSLQYPVDPSCESSPALPAKRADTDTCGISGKFGVR